MSEWVEAVLPSMKVHRGIGVITGEAVFEGEIAVASITIGSAIDPVSFLSARFRSGTRIIGRRIITMITRRPIIMTIITITDRAIIMITARRLLLTASQI